MVWNAAHAAKIIEDKEVSAQAEEKRPYREGTGQMNTACGTSDAVVLTTHERSGYFTSVLGDDIDLRFDPHHGGTLDTVLHNTIAAGGSLAIIDEAFFVDSDDMAMGLESFFREESNPERLKLIIVCTHRDAGDVFLAFLVMYCGIYNIIYGKTGIDVSIALDRLIRRDNTRVDVLHLAEAGCWREAKLARERAGLGIADHDATSYQAAAGKGDFRKVSRDVLIDVRNLRLEHMHIELSAVSA